MPVVLFKINNPNSFIYKRGQFKHRFKYIYPFQLLIEGLGSIDCKFIRPDMYGDIVTVMPVLRICGRVSRQGAA